LDHDPERHDQHLGKGATGAEDHKIPGNVGMVKQLGHLDQDPMLKDADTDFPEPEMGRMSAYSKIPTSRAKNAREMGHPVNTPQARLVAPQPQHWSLVRVW